VRASVLRLVGEEPLHPCLSLSQLILIVREHGSCSRELLKLSLNNLWSIKLVPVRASVLHLVG